MAFDCLQYFEDNVEKAKSSAGGNWTGVCPSCQKFGGFYCQLDADHPKYGQFVCYKCEFRSASFAYLIQTIEGCDAATARKMFRRHDEIVFTRRVGTVATLRERLASMRAPDEALTADIWDELREASTGTELPSEFIPVYSEKRKRKWSVPNYMTERGFMRETLRAWNVGYCERGKYAGRVIIPLECPNGNSFTARDLTGEGIPKYLNPTGVDHSLLLFGWKHVKPGADFAIVEGPLDAMKLYQWGIHSVAFGGKSLSSAQLNLLFSFPESASVTVMLDPDAISNAYRVASLLKLHFRNVFVAKIPPTDEHGNKLDPGASTAEQALAWYEDAPVFSGSRTPRATSAILESLEKFKKRFG